MENICTCNKCGDILIDTNPQTNAKKFDVDYLELEELIDNKCPICNTASFLDDSVYKVLWDRLGDIPVNEDDEIEKRFLHFKIGSDKNDIWHWFEYHFDISIAKDLMFYKYNYEKNKINN